LKGSTGFEGHLKLDNVYSIQLQSKNHRGRESHAFVFCDNNGDAIFKVFLGRDGQGELLPDQLAKFKTIQSSLSIQ
jgi:putative heme iron utilization protein